MGWTSYHKDKNTTPTEELRKLLKWSDETAETHPVEVGSATGPGCVAFAVKFPKGFRNGKGTEHYIPDADGSYTAALVFMFRESKDYYNFSYKDMDEHCGPYSYVSPKILKHLSKLNPDHPSAKNAADWRESCQKIAEAAKRKRSIKAGMTVKLAEPVSFGGVKCDEFVAEAYYSRGKAKLAFRASNGTLCRLMARHLEQATIG